MVDNEKLFMDAQDGGNKKLKAVSLNDVVATGMRAIVGSTGIHIVL